MNDPVVALVHEAENDYILMGASCWIEVEDLVIYIVNCGSGVSVEVYPSGREYEAPIDTLAVDFGG